jgi:hypothetical protein
MEIPMDNQENALSSFGRLIIKATTARGAIPIGGALVHVSFAEENDGAIISSAFTDSSGNTAPLSLPAPPRMDSMSPQSAGAPKPYALYNIQVEADGFYPQSFINAPVFDSVTSIQGVDLIPLSENENTDFKRYDPFVIYETPSNNL